MFFLLINISYASDEFNTSDAWNERPAPEQPETEMERVAIKAVRTMKTVVEGKIRGSIDRESGKTFFVTIDQEPDDPHDAHKIIRYKVCNLLICAETPIKYFVEEHKELENDQYEAAKYVNSANYKFGPVIINGKAFKVVKKNKCSASVSEVSAENNTPDNPVLIDLCKPRN